MRRRLISLVLVGALMLTAAFTFTSCGGGSNGELNLICYGDYYDPEIVAEFEAETGISVVQDTYDTAEELYTMLANGAVSYDVICTSDYMIEKMISEDLLAEINYDNVPEIVNIDDLYMEKSAIFDPGNKYSVPYQVGYAGLAYNKKMVGDTVIDSWDDLWDPQFKENIVMPNSVRDAFMIALLRRGYDMNTTNEAEIAEASKDLIAQKPLVYKYANDDARELLADGSAAIGVVWNGEYSYITDLNEDVDVIIPKEGTEFFIDSWAIPASAENKDNAEAWINFLCKKEVAATNFDYLYYTTPNKACLSLIDQDALNNPAIFPSQDALRKCHSLKSMSTDVMELYSNYWKKVKAN